eukprot:gene18671-6094_t
MQKGFSPGPSPTIRSGSPQQVKVPGAMGMRAIRVRANGMEANIVMNENSTMGELKTEIYKSTGFAQGRQVLRQGGKPVPETVTIAQAGLVDGCTIVLNEGMSKPTRRD